MSGEQQNLSPRAQQQRARILTAAESCFVKHGFHAASMAQIAEATQMSAGLIYRYFPSKSAIILAIIKQQLEAMREDIQQLSSVNTLTSRLMEMFRLWQKHDNRIVSVALFMEMSAEASRDKEIAEALQESDSELRDGLASWLMRPVDQGGGGLDSENAHRNALILQCFINGLSLRALREKDLDENCVRAAVDQFVEGMLTCHRKD